MNFAARSIGWKLVATIGGGIVALVAVALLASWTAWKDLAWFKREVERRDTVTPLVLMIDADFRGQVQQWKNILLRGGDPVARAVHWASFEALETRTQSQAQLLREAVSDPDVRQGIDDFIRAHREAGKRYRAGLEVYDRTGFDARAADAVVIGVDRGPMAILKRTSANIRHASQVSFDATIARVENRALSLLVGVVACAVAVGLLALWIVWAWVVIPTRQVLSELDHLVAGNFDFRSGLTSQDEIGQIAARVDSIRRTLARMLHRPEERIDAAAAMFCEGDTPSDDGNSARVR